MRASVSINNAKELERIGLQEGDPVHLGVAGPGQSTNDAIFEGRLLEHNRVVGIKIRVHGQVQELWWGDIIEFWPLSSPDCLSRPQKDGRLHRFHERVEGTAD